MNRTRQPDTNPSIFLRLNRTDTELRELAWEEFHQRYAAMIAGFARQLGVRSPVDVDDVVQDVLLGFYATSPAFVYDPAKGRFRSYLKRCTFHTAHRRLGREAKFRGAPLEQVDPEALEVEQAWNDVWEQEQLRRAVEEVRRDIASTKTFRAFEMYVILDLPPQEVSRNLDLHIDNVYRAKESVTRMLRERLNALRAAEDDAGRTRMKAPRDRGRARHHPRHHARVGRNATTFSLKSAARPALREANGPQNGSVDR